MDRRAFLLSCVLVEDGCNFFSVLTDGQEGLLVVMCSGRRWMQFLLRSYGWTGGPSCCHVFWSKMDAISSPFLRMDRRAFLLSCVLVEDGCNFFSVLTDGQEGLLV